MIKLPVLVAYPYMSQKVVDALKGRDDVEFLLDSGAFTADKSGKPINLDEYCKYIEASPLDMWGYFALDVIGDPERTMRNYETMLERGFKPIPIFTRGQDPSDMDIYYETSDIVGCGGIAGAGLTQKHIALNVQLAMKQAKGRQLHLLGYTALDYLKHFKPFSCDSSSWTSGARYGKACIYQGNGRMKKVGKEKFVNRPDEKTMDILSQMGLDPYSTRLANEWKGNRFLMEVGAASWLRLSLDMRKNIDTRLFLAVAATVCLDVLFKQLDNYRRLERA